MTKFEQDWASLSKIKQVEASLNKTKYDWTRLNIDCIFLGYFCIILLLRSYCKVKVSTFGYHNNIIKRCQDDLWMMPVIQDWTSNWTSQSENCLTLDESNCYRSSDGWMLKKSLTFLEVVWRMTGRDGWVVFHFLSTKNALLALFSFLSTSQLVAAPLMSDVSTLGSQQL